MDLIKNKTRRTENIQFLVYLQLSAMDKEESLPVVPQILNKLYLKEFLFIIILNSRNIIFCKQTSLSLLIWSKFPLVCLQFFQHCFPFRKQITPTPLSYEKLWILLSMPLGASGMLSSHLRAPWVTCAFTMVWARHSHAKLLKTALIAAWQNKGNPHMEMPPRVNTPFHSSARITIIHSNSSANPPPQLFAELEHSVQYLESLGGGISQVQSMVHVKIWNSSADRNDSKIKPWETVSQRTALVFINWL